MYHAQTKHIELDVQFICNLIVDKQLEVRYVPTAKQPTDLLTKALPISREQRMTLPELQMRI